MRIAVTGTNGVGKSTFIESMMNTWKCFSVPEKSFRDDIKERYTTEVDADRQQTILDSMVDQLRTYGKKDNIIYDRCPVDNLVYTLYGYAHGEDVDDDNITEEFVLKSAAALKEALRMIDLILFIPITSQDNINIESNLEGKGDLDVSYAKEIDHIFKALYKEWDKRGSPYVDFEDKPHVVEVFGTPEERIELAKLYIDVTGEAFGEGQIIKPDELEDLHHMNELLTQQEELTEDSRLDI